MHNSPWSSDLEALAAYLPEGCGGLLYVRSASPPWDLRAIVGDIHGVLGVPALALQQVWTELVHPEDEPRLLEALARLGIRGSATLDYRVRTTSGGERWVRDSMQRVPDPSAGGSIVGLLRDVSVERTLRSQIAALEERIWKAQRVDSLGGLAAGIAHDLGNLLTATLSAVQLVESREDIPASAQEDLAVARESARKGSDFVRQILRFAARESGRPGAVDLNSLLDDLRIILGRSLGSKIRLEFVQESDLPKVHCDPVQMEQVLLNLSVNARDAMPQGGILKIATEVTRITEETPAQGSTLRPGQYAILSVSDTGRGIPEQVRQRIFEPFFSTKSSTGSNSGFGLSTVQRIVQSHRGVVRVESVEGRGTTFRIYLPIRDVTSEALEVAGASGESETRARILVVEADPAVREVVKRVLVLEGFGVLAVGSAREALRNFDRVRPTFDLVITDHALPDRSGADLARQLRKRAERLAVVYLVGYATHAVPLVPEETGTLHLEKPFTPSQLVETVEEALAWIAQSPARSAGSSGSH